MSWLNVTIKLPAHWVTETEDGLAVPNVVGCIENYLGESVDVDHAEGDYVLYSTSGHARYGIASIGVELDELSALRVPWWVDDDGQGDEVAPPTWTMYDGREPVGEYLLHGHVGNIMSRGELVAILDGTHAWAKTPLGYFDEQPSIADAPITHLVGARHPDDEDDIDDDLAVL